MTTALPAASVATNSSATQGDVKNWLTSLHDYLAGLLGTDGTTATALATLNFTPPTDFGYSAIGGLCFAYVNASSSISAGNTISGSSLIPAGTVSTGLAPADGNSLPLASLVASGALAGTWRCLGYAPFINGGFVLHAATLFQRIA